MPTRVISWVKPAQKAFLDFPQKARTQGLSALTIAAEGGKADIAKPLTGIEPGVLEIVLNDRAGTFRVVYATKVGDDLWVIHAFQKKSKSGIKTPLNEIAVVKERLKRLRELLR